MSVYRFEKCHKSDKETSNAMDRLSIEALDSDKALRRAATEIWHLCGWENQERCYEHLTDSFCAYEA